MRSEDLLHSKQIIKTLNYAMESIKQLQDKLREEFDENVFNTNRSMNLLEMAIKQLEEINLRK